MEGNEPPVGVSDGIELAMQRRAEGVVRTLMHVTKDCSLTAGLLPLPYPMKVVDLFVGLCIQEVAALSALLGTHFETRKWEVLSFADRAAFVVIGVCCRQPETTSQQRHALRLVKYAKQLRNTKPDNPPIANEDRLKMLGELLDLQETALRLIHTFVQTFLSEGLQHPETPVSAEAAHEFTEELKRIVYIRRSQVFMSKHLSHLLRVFEANRVQGRLVRVPHLNAIDASPRKTLDKQLVDLTDPSTWLKNPLYTTQRPPKGESSAEQREPQDRHSAAPTSDQATKTPDGGRPPLPGHSTGQASLSDCRKGEAQAQKSQAEMDSSNSEQTQQAPGGISPPSEAEMMQAAQIQTEATPVYCQLLPELDTAFSELSVVSKLGWDDHPSSDPAASSLTASSQPVLPPAKGTEASWYGRDANWNFGLPTETTGSPRTSAQWQRPPYLPQVPIPDLNAQAASHTPEGLQGGSAGDPLQNGASSQWGLMTLPASPPSLFPFTTPQSIASEGTEMLYSLRSQGQSADIHRPSRPHSRPFWLTREHNSWSVDMTGSSDLEGRTGSRYIMGQGMAQGGGRRQDTARPPSSVSAFVRQRGDAVNEDALRESAWLDKNTDSR
ncbi:hypothetical protein EMWEY_00050250 [Eimeria maxima]|uniref:Uncharacterized protein n=1 Tax=Eimeria maxima TaxID=5804 RepID=U6M2B4_EIMMA|nr:hypothetical protein EMWEY_00050250 [Eimeria maxima]CDJ58382.1 hypothetical protein EMWEY_00050250 [Eimeria maxima]